MTNTLKPLTVGLGNCIMLLAGNELGHHSALIAEAKRHLAGSPIHPSVAASIEREAVRLNDILRADSKQLDQANAKAEALKTQYGFQSSGPVVSRAAGRALDAAFPWGYQSPDSEP